MSDGRGVLYIVWGEQVEPLLQRSLGSLRALHPELPVHVERLAGDGGLLDKARMLEITPYEQTLFLDADTVVLGRLDWAFEQAERVGLACAICECPWARRYGGIEGELIEYNTGVLFYSAKARAVFDRWVACADKIDSSIQFLRGGELCTMPHNDQAGFARAVVDTGFVPFVLPCNWNLRPEWHKSFFGPIKVWHDYRPVPEALIEWNANQEPADSVIQYTELR
jgi:hypothetical protein